MGTLALLVLIMLAASQRGLAKGVPPTAAEPTAAHEHARRAHHKAQQTGKPEDHAAAAAAAASATAAKKTSQAATVPRPWPQAVPKGLPPWPSGWTPASPPTPGIVARAWQLLPKLWAKGQGSIATEQTDGQWITYLATMTGGNTKGVVAFKIKPGAPRGGVALVPGGGRFGGGGASADFG